jgi:Flp pilus assembly protein TadD
LGERHVASKDYRAAEKHYLAAMTVQPDSAIILNNLAFVTAQLGKDGALAYAEQANNIAPNNPEFMDTWAMVLAKQGDYDKAIQLQIKALSLQPDNASIRLNLAKIYIKSGDKAKANAELVKLAKLGDSFPRQPEVQELLKTL